MVLDPVAIPLTPGTGSLATLLGPIALPGCPAWPGRCAVSCEEGVPTVRGVSAAVRTLRAMPARNLAPARFSAAVYRATVLALGWRVCQIVFACSTRSLGSLQRLQDSICTLHHGFCSLLNILFGSR